MAGRLGYDRTNEHLRMIILLDKMARKVVEEFVNFGWVDQNSCLDLTSVEQMTRAANSTVNSIESAGYNAQYIDQVQPLGLGLVQKLKKGEAFDTKNELLTARLLERAENLSRPCLRSFRELPSAEN
jgi:hypothetical protein